MHRKFDVFTKKEIPKLKKECGVNYDEVTWELVQKGFSFHLSNSKDLHTDLEDVLDPSKWINVNQSIYFDIYRSNINVENQFNEFIDDYKFSKCNNSF